MSKVSFGFGSAGTDLTGKSRPGFGGGTGAGIRIDPIGFLIIKDGSVRMLNIMPPPNTTLDRILDMLPTFLDKAEGDERKTEGR